MDTTTLYQENRRYLRNLAGSLGPCVNAAKCREKLQLITSAERDLEATFNDYFYFLVNLREMAITWTWNAGKHLRIEGATNGDTSIDLLYSLKIIHPAFIPLYLAFGHASYEMLKDDGIRQRIHTLDQQYSIRIPIERQSGQYWWVKQVALPFELDANNRVISHLNKYHFIEPYESGPIQKPMIQFGKGREVRQDLVQILLGKLPAEFIHQLVNFRPGHLKLLQGYEANPSANNRQLSDKLKMNQNTIQKYNKEIMSTVNHSFSTRFTTARDAALYICNLLGPSLFKES